MAGSPSPVYFLLPYISVSHLLLKITSCLMLARGMCFETGFCVVYGNGFPGSNSEVGFSHCIGLCCMPIGMSGGVGGLSVLWLWMWHDQCSQCSGHLNFPISVSYSLNFSFKLLCQVVVSGRWICGVGRGTAKWGNPVAGFRVSILRERLVACYEPF